MNHRYARFAGWSSLVARLDNRQEVVGSNPAPATNQLFYVEQTFTLTSTARE